MGSWWKNYQLKLGLLYTHSATQPKTSMTNAWPKQKLFSLNPNVVSRGFQVWSQNKSHEHTYLQHFSVSPSRTKLTKLSNSCSYGTFILRPLPFSQSSREEAGKWRDHRALGRGTARAGGGEGLARCRLHVFRPAETLHHRHPVRHRLLHLLRYPV